MMPERMSRVGIDHEDSLCRAGTHLKQQTCLSALPTTLHRRTSQLASRADRTVLGSKSRFTARPQAAAAKISPATTPQRSACISMLTLDHNLIKHAGLSSTASSVRPQSGGLQLNATLPSHWKHIRLSVRLSVCPSVYPLSHHTSSLQQQQHRKIPPKSHLPSAKPKAKVNPSTRPLTKASQASPKNAIKRHHSAPRQFLSCPVLSCSAVPVLPPHADYISSLSPASKQAGNSR